MKNFDAEVSSFSHELKHYIDRRLRKSEKISYKTSYGITHSLLEIDNMLPTLTKLFFLVSLLKIGTNEKNYLPVVDFLCFHFM